MRLLVLFGSKSDENIYQPLLKKLETRHQVEFEVLSAHRQPEELGLALKQSDARAIVAGAGLAAHLPGVVASKTTVPVFGVPVAANFGGLDALLSIQQMPFGVPVLACAPACEDAIVAFLDRMEEGRAGELSVVVNDDPSKEHIAAELSRLRALAKGKGRELSLVDEVPASGSAIVFVNRESDVCGDAGAIHVPLLDNLKKKDFRAVLDVYQWVCRGGLWVGVNNSRNALLFFEKTRRESDR